MEATDDRESGIGPLAIARLVDEIATFPTGSRQRGHQYCATGRVGPIAIGDRTIRAKVRGSRQYDVLWTWDEGWSCDCNCPVGPECKHAYALALAAITQVDHGPDEKAARPAPQRPAARGSPTARRTLLQDLVAAQGWERLEILQAILFDAPADLVHDARVSDILKETDAELLPFRLARYLHHALPGPLPDLLAPYLDREDLAAREANRHEAALLERVQQWARQPRADSTRSLRATLRIETVWKAGFTLHVEPRLTSNRLRDEPRSNHQLEQLASETRRTPGTLTPDQVDLLDMLIPVSAPNADHPPEASVEGVLSLVRRFSGTPAVSWGADLPAAFVAASGVTAGSVVELGAGSADIVLSCIDRQGSPRLALDCAFPDGARRDFAGVAFVRGVQDERGLVVADGRLWHIRDSPPWSVVSAFLETGDAALTANGPLLGALAVRFPSVRDAIAPRTRRLAVTPMVAMELCDDDWLRVQAYAATGAWQPGAALDGQRVFEYTAEAQWRDAKRNRTNAPLGLVDGAAAEPREASADDAPAWIEMPDPEALEPLSAWLASLPLRRAIQMYSHAPAADATLGLRLGPKTADALAEAWERRPPHVLFYGDERVQRLLGRSPTARPRIRIESTGIDWWSVSAEWEAEGERLTEADIARLRGSSSRMVKLASGWVRRDTTGHDEALTRAMADLGLEPGEGAERLTLWQLARAGESSLRALEGAGGDAETARAIANLREKVGAFRGLPRVDLPNGLCAELRPYQREGLDFLAWNSSMGLGAVLADDMGLGKTVQALAWLLHLRASDEKRGPALVVCPTSVLHNWAREAARFAPELRVLVLEAGAKRHDLRREVPAADLVLTTYALLRRDLEAWESADLFAAILDEAQFIKNPDAVVAAAARKLRARHRLALTGTPLENRALDLWSILSFAAPGVLGGRTAFAARYDRADAPPHVRTLLAARLRPVLLRRLKSEVARDLPDRIEERLDCQLSDGQRRLYLAELARARDTVRDLADNDSDLRRSRIQVLALLTKLRQICCHATLGGGKAALGSGKIDTLFELLEPLLAEGHKVLVYSQFVRFLKIVEGELESRGIAFHKLTGATTGRDRVVSAFAEDHRPCVFLLSLKAGGTGLNLTAASYVVLLDPWWNPAVEAQAIDRSHRIGQDRTVIAYRLVTRGTVEEKIHELQQRKLALVRDVLGEEGFARALSRDDLDYLLAAPEE